MVLLIPDNRTDDGLSKVVSDGSSHALHHNVLANATLHRCATDFIDQAVIQLDSPNADLLYVHQAEMAAIVGRDSPRDVEHPAWLGSADATSCHIVVMTTNDATILGHLDGACDAFFDQAKALLTRQAVGGSGGRQRVNVDIIGGFLDNRGQSYVVTDGILSRLAGDTSLEYCLGVCCVGPWNDRVDAVTGLHHPRITDVVVSTEATSVRVSPACIGLAARGPLGVLRYSQLYSATGVPNVYDSDSRHLVVNSFDYDEVAVRTRPSASAPISTLRRFSTTPDQEPAHFYTQMRSVSRLIDRHPHPLLHWFKAGSLTFSFDRAVGWRPCDVVSAAMHADPLGMLIPPDAVTKRSAVGSDVTSSSLS